MKRAKNILWGIVLVALGALLILKVLNIVDFDLFFDGWWTLFIIIPSVVGIFTDRDKLWAIVGTIVGVVILLSKQDVIEDGAVFKLIVPIIVLLIGLKMIFKDFLNKGLSKAKKKISADGTPIGEYAATFSNQNLDFTDEIFSAVELNAIFGGIKCDLSSAIITDGSVINVCAVFGGVDIIVPDNVNVKISSTSIFGGMDDERKSKNITPESPTLYVTGTCIFGGTDIK